MKTKFICVTLFLFLFCSLSSLKAQDYNNAVGLRLAWGYGLTGKFFLNERAAIEGILNYRSYGVPGFKYNYLRVTGLYEIHNDISSIDGLRWYYGGGAFVGFYGGDWDDYYTGNESSTYIGLAGVLGLDYKFESVPINLSVDWIPSFVITGYGNGFTAENGGLAVRFTF
ncbi:MAG: hypothetical protein M3Q56_01500 [Bacteroidota bacterium]|nr:hypothetical protein [Bacteroidota bacterium]